MTVSAAIVLFCVTWFMLLFVILPIGMQSQGEAGEVVPGTHASAPANLNLKRKFLIVTLVSIPIWALACGVIISDKITLDMFDIYKQPVTH